MSWRDSLTWADTGISNRKASFKGVYFFISGSERTIGQRNVIHKYPKKTDPYVENLGLEPTEFSVVGYVVQNIDNDFDYFDERDQLIEALEDPTPGTLIHPFYGERTVILNGNFKIEENFNNGGIARFTIPFIETKVLQSPYPKETIDPTGKSDEVINEKTDLVRDGFGEWYKPENLPSDKIIEVMQQYNKKLRYMISTLRRTNPAQIDRGLQKIDEVYGQISPNNACKFGSDILDLADSFLTAVGIVGQQFVTYLLGECSGLIRGVYEGPMSSAKRLVKQVSTGFGVSTLTDTRSLNEKVGKNAVKNVLSLSEFGDNTDGVTEVKLVTVVGLYTARLHANQVATINLIRFCSIRQAITLATRIDYTSYESSLEVLQWITDAIEKQLLKIGNDANDIILKNYGLAIQDNDSYNSLKALKAEFTKIMIEVGTNLIRIVNYEIPYNIDNVLSLVYDRYEDLDRYDDVMSRNKSIEHPGFLENGKFIEILNE